MKLIRKTLLFLVAGLAPFCLLEAVLWITDYRPSDAWYYEGFDGADTIFQNTDGLYTLAPGKENSFHAEPFRTDRKPGTLLVFSVGDSVVWGFGGNEATGPIPTFSEILQERLRDRTSTNQHQVVNCGARTYASLRVLGVLREVLRYKPDAVVASFGSSELLEASVQRSLATRESRSPRWFWELRFMQLLETAVRKMAGQDVGVSLAGLRERSTHWTTKFVNQSDTLSADALDALLDKSETNVRQMVAASQKASVPLILMTVPGNLRFPPFASRCDDEASRPSLEALATRSGELLQANRPGEVIDLLRTVSRSNPEVASLHFLLAQAYDMIGDTSNAKIEYLAARETDAFPLRALGRFNEMLRQIASSEAMVYLVDAERILSDMVPDGIPDDRLLIDHCHMKEIAYAEIGDRLADTVQALALPSNGGL